jgi:hypothetical protein
MPDVAETPAISFESFVQMFSMNPFLLFWVFCCTDCSMKELQEQAHPPIS